MNFLDSEKKMFKKSLKKMRDNVLVGFFLTIPVVTTIFIFKFLFGLATDWLPETMFPELRSLWYGDILLQVITLLAMVAALYIVGLLVRNIIGRRLFQVSDGILARIPFIKGIYKSVSKISESLFTQRKTLFKEVVLVQYPRKGLYSLAFVTAKAPEAVAEKMTRNKKERCVSLFISTTPNPTSGVFILVPESEITPLDMPVTDALTFIMSAGAVATSGDPNQVKPTLLDKLESWLRHDSNAEHDTEADNAPATET
jgi:uncharacterized membrane protein